MLNKRFRNALNDKFWLETCFFHCSPLLQLLAINPIFVGSLCLFSLLRLLAGKMIALQEYSYRKENRIWLLFAKKKIKKAANNVSARGSFSPF